jgi:hypothetical protein
VCAHYHRASLVVYAEAACSKCCALHICMLPHQAHACQVWMGPSWHSSGAQSSLNATAKSGPVTKKQKPKGWAHLLRDVVCSLTTLLPLSNMNDRTQQAQPPYTVYCKLYSLASANCILSTLHYSLALVASQFAGVSAATQLHQPSSCKVCITEVPHHS